MEIIKQTENFTLTEATEAYAINGSITNSASGQLNVHFTISKAEGEHIGDCYYNKQAETGSSNFSLTCPEENRSEVTTYTTSVIDSVLDYFKQVD